MEPLQPAPSLVFGSVPDPNAAIPVQEGGERGSVCTRTFDGHEGEVRGVGVSHDNQWVISTSDDGSVLFWDARNAQAQFSLHAHIDRVGSIDISSTAGIFATVGWGGTTRICEPSMYFTRSIYSECIQGNTNE